MSQHSKRELVDCLQPRYLKANLQKMEATRRLLVIAANQLPMCQGKRPKCPVLPKPAGAEMRVNLRCSS